MKTIKPLTLSLLHRVFEREGRCHFVVTGLVFVSLDDSPFPLSELALWKELPQEIPSGILDEAMPKSFGEVLLSGSAFVPGGKSAIATDVRVRCGPVDKKLRVVGDRAWDAGGAATEPVPFHEMPLDWSRAFGGEGFAENPLGRGFGDGAGTSRSLPSVEDPRAMVQAPGDRPTPAGFGAFDFAWPQRHSKLGTYDARWLKEDAPGYARDIDWTTFNVAPPDQRLPGFFQGDEAYVLENLHAERPRIEGRLPGLAVRAFVNRRAPSAGGEEVFEEIPTHLDTVHFLPRALRAVLVYRGTTTVREDDAHDVLHLLAGIERRGEPRPVDHYRTVLRERLDPEKGARYAFRERDLTPSGAPSAFDGLGTIGPASEGLLAARSRRRAERELERSREQLRARGIDPDQHLPAKLPEPEPPPALEDLPEAVDRAQILATEQQASAEARRQEAETKARELATRRGLDYDQLVARAKAAQGRPNRLSVDAQLVVARAQIARAKERGLDTSAADAKLDHPAFRAQLEEVRTKTALAHRMSAHFMPAPPALDPADQARLQDDVRTRRARGEGFAGADLAGVDLSGMDLSKGDLREALLEGAILRGADLTGADFTDAVLAHADLTEAVLTRATFKGANLGSARLTGARAEGPIDLTGATVWSSDLSGCSLPEASLGGATLFEVSLAGADLRGLRAEKAMFYKADLTGTKLAGADLRGATFMECTVSGADLSRARLKGATFVKCEGEGASFRGADAENLRIVHESAFEKADFVEASLPGSTLRGTKLAGALFGRAKLDRTDFSECDLRNAIFFQAMAGDARFVRADLTGAALVSAGLLGAILQKANLEGADFTNANLFGADMARTRGRPKSLEGAELGRVRVVQGGANG